MDSSPPDIWPQVPGGAARLSNCFCLDYRPLQMTVGLVPPVCLNLTNVHKHSYYLNHLIVTLKGLICLVRGLDYKLFRNYGKSKRLSPCEFFKNIFQERCVLCVLVGIQLSKIISGSARTWPQTGPTTNRRTEVSSSRGSKVPAS